MQNQKHPVPNLGNLPEAGAQRDAIHIAVAPLEALHHLRPGDAVDLLNGKAIMTEGKPIGVVDPFLTRNVRPGETFWLMLNPQTITSLKHVWTHPAFEDETPVEPPTNCESARWIQEYAEQLNVTYRDLIEGGKEWVESRKNSPYGAYLCKGGELEGVSTAKEFWPHFEKVTGISVDEDKRENFFTCSC